MVPFDPIPPEVLEARERAKRDEARRASLRRGLVQAVGWITLLSILAVLGAFVYAQRDFIRRGVTELSEGTPPDPARVGAFQLRITSVPSGAHVFEGTHDHGPTPLELTVVRTQAADHPRQFRLELPGYTTVTAVQANTLSPLAELRVTLIPANPRVAPPPPPVASAPTDAVGALPTVVTTRRGHPHRRR